METNVNELRLHNQQVRITTDDKKNMWITTTNNGQVRIDCPSDTVHIDANELISALRRITGQEDAVVM